MEFSSNNIGVYSHSLLQGIFRTQGLNLGFLHCRQILHHLSHQGSPNFQRSLSIHLQRLRLFLLGKSEVNVIYLFAQQSWGVLLAPYYRKASNSQVTLVIKTLPAHAGDARDLRGLLPCPGGGHDNSLQYSCLENLKDRGAWWATVLGVSKSQTQLNTYELAHMHA